MALPTDRFVARWSIQTDRVAARLAGARPGPPPPDAVPVNSVKLVGRWGACREVVLDSNAPHLLVRVPTAFAGMLEGAPNLAREWRDQTRTIFTTYFRVATARWSSCSTNQRGREATCWPGKTSRTGSWSYAWCCICPSISKTKTKTKTKTTPCVCRQPGGHPRPRPARRCKWM